jgi:photosystem II stability/assembly factor-like uncharacterized protein
MKKNLIVLMLLFILDSGNAQWHSVHPYPQNEDLNSVCFVDSLTGTAVGLNIIKTTDGGESWAFQESSMPGYLWSVSFCDPNNGMITTESGWVQVTTDGGEHWNLRYAGVNTPLYGAYRLSPAILFAVGKNGRIIKSTDGGVNWINLNSGDTLDLKGVYFTTENKGIAVGESGTILLTTNGGSTWSAVSSGFQNNLNSVAFYDEINGSAVGDGIILKTTNGGTSWQTINSYNKDCYAVTFKDSLKGAIAAADWVGVTNDGGESWYFTSAGPLYNLKSVTYKGSLIMGVGLKGGMFFARDGLNWEGNTLTLEALHSVFVIDSNNVIAVGKKGIILKSTNGGTEWFILPSSTPGDLNDVYFSDPNNGFIIGKRHISGGYPVFLFTTDGGQSWVYRDYGSNRPLERIDFADENNGVIVGQWIVMFTSDGGSNWIRKDNGVSNRGVDFKSSDNCYAVGSGQILRTTDMGETWTTILCPECGAEPFNDINIIDDQKILSFSGNISRTLDGGIIWKRLAKPGSDAQFFSDNVGISVGLHYILSTTNGGIEWVYHDTPLGNTTRLYKVNFLNTSLGFACGSNGVILRNTYPVVELTGFNEPERNVTPIEYNLLQNYPNPFNPSTVIEFSLPDFAEISLTVYDVLGREVAQIAEGNYAPGKHAVTFNASDLSSGIYFYTLSAGNFKQSKKLILMR